MSWYRKVKSVYSITLVTISFIIWSTLSKWIFKNPVDYKLFLITLCIVFLTQYLNSIKLKKSLLILATLSLSVLACYILFKGQIVLLNAIFLLFMGLISYLLEDSPVDHAQYKEDIIKSMVALILIWVVSFALGIQFVNAMYRFHIFYIIMIIILLRETRRYVYDVKSNKSMGTNIIIGISVLVLSLDFANKIIAGLLDMLMRLANFILYIIISILIKIFGGPISWISEKLRILFLKREWTLFANDSVIEKNMNKQLVVTEYKGIEIPPMLILVFKMLVLLLILYGIYKFLSRFRSKRKNYNGFVEEKERIVKKKNKKHWVKNFIDKVFQANKSNRDKILYTYKGFEKITEEANIYKPYMTATQLKNVTKIYVDNFDNLDDMTKVYNEAKFSLHPMTQEKV